jgi:hypothetical protein
VTGIDVHDDPHGKEDSPGESMSSEAVWNPVDLKKEETRGLFAIGVVATLVVVHSLGAAQTYLPITQVILNFVALFLLAFWTMYMVLTAFSMANIKRGMPSMSVLIGFRRLADTMYDLGLWMSTILILFYSPFLISEVIAANAKILMPSSLVSIDDFFWYVSFVELGVSAIVIGYYLKRKYKPGKTAQVKA